jgi:hypothetical protein
VYDRSYEAWKLETGHKLPEALKLLVCISGLRVMTPFSKGGYIIEEIPICDFSLAIVFASCSRKSTAGKTCCEVAVA